MKPRNKPISLAALTAALLGACTGGGQSLSLSPPNSQIYYFRGFATIDVDYMNRYACLDRWLLPKCKCTSRLERTCDCWC